MAEVVLSKTSEEEMWTVDVTEKKHLARWTRLTTQAGGTIEQKSAAWTRFRIPADKLRFGLKRQVTLTDAQRTALAARMRAARGGAVQE